MNNIKDILISELTQASSYIDRLLHAATEVSEAKGHPKLRVIASDLTESLETMLRTNHLNERMKENTLIHRESLKASKANFKILTNVFESLLFLGDEKKNLIINTCNFINETYIYAQKIHKIVTDDLGIDVQIPRLGILKEIDNSEPKQKPQIIDEGPRQYGPFVLIEGGAEDEEILEDQIEEFENLPLLYQLDISEMLNLFSGSEVSLLGLETKRNEKYEALLAEGHKFAFNKKYEEALESFEKAWGFRETAEIVTLVAWVHNILGNNEKSKSLCIKAIGLDPDYGPPYNDLGSILLSEGQLEESLKWFNLAKKASKYQNKEYPYINSGRALLMTGKNNDALKEFEKAIELCPHNEELINTVEKIKSGLKRPSEKDNFSFKTNFSTDDDSPTL
ncbi:MAG: hypothetical protein VX341_05310 [Bdellovibrionota bacterium]|nr:hypothetical protein [Bdellovibrionota bacterium]